MKSLLREGCVLGMPCLFRLIPCHLCICSPPQTPTPASRSKQNMYVLYFFQLVVHCFFDFLTRFVDDEADESMDDEGDAAYAGEDKEDDENKGDDTRRFVPSSMTLSVLVS